jgi:hypothetical protein
LNCKLEDIDGGNMEHSNDLRQWFMFGQFQPHDPFNPAVHEPLLRQECTETEHPLRTDKWELNIRWRKGDGSHKLQQANGTQQSLGMDLHHSGYVRVWSKSQSPVSSSQTPIAVGRWHKNPWGVSMIIRPLETSNSRSPVGSSPSSSLSISQDLEWVLFASSFHMNPFGKHPKLKRGTILLQRPTRWILDDGTDSMHSSQTWRLVWKRHQQWFRPVVGKFSAYGVGAQE